MVGWQDRTNYDASGDDVTMQARAVELAELGWRVIPIWWLEQHGETKLCGCGDPYCTAAGKHPLIKTGRKHENASNDPEQVGKWWDQWPTANIAVVVGQESGIFVVDCDITGDHDGEFEFQAWCAANGVDLPDTLMQETGSGGRHYLFAFPQDGIPLKNCTAWLEDVDIKSEGGYILVAPSTHESGGGYHWRNLGTPVAEAPQVLINNIRVSKSRAGAAARGEDPDAPTYDYRRACKEGAKSGFRDDFFNRRAFELRKSGASKEEATEDLRRLWKLTEQPPHDEFPWEAVLGKMSRVWDEVDVDPLPEWDPFAHRPTTAKVVLLNDQPEDMLSDVGNAWRLITKYADHIRHTKAQGWLVWDGTRWQSDDRDVIYEYARKTAESVFQEALGAEDDHRERLIDWARKSHSRQRIEAMVKLTNTFDRAKVDITDFDADPFLLTVPNGTLNLRTGELLDHGRDHLISKMSPVEYHPDAYDERWVEYLTSTTDSDPDLISYLQRAAGYTLTGSTAEEAFFMLYGPTASGKSTFVTAMQTLLGDYAMTTMPENLMHRKTNQIPQNELARMRGMRLVASTEPSETDRFAESLIKQMTGGDKITGRLLYREGFDFEPQFKLWIASNAQPRVNDEAMFRRLKLVPFPVSIPPHRRDHQLKLELKDPSSAVAQAAFAWAVRGCLEWQKNGLGTADAVERDTRAYQSDQDQVGQFVGECLEVTAVTTDEVPAKDVYAAYKEWSVERGEHPMTYRSLNRSLEKHGLKIVKKRSVSIAGVKLVREPLFWPAGGSGGQV